MILFIFFIIELGKENFREQKKYVAKYALDLVNLKEEEHKKSYALEERTIRKQPPSDIKINGNNAEGFMSFTEQLVNYDGSTYDLITEGKVLLEKTNNEWKIIDYTRKNRLISEALYLFDEIKVTQNNIDVEIIRVLFSLYDSYVVVKFKIANNNDPKISLSPYNSVIIGSDKIQNKSTYNDESLYEIFQNAITIGEIQYNWTNDSTGNFIIYTGDFHDNEGYRLFNSFPIEVDLNKAIRY